jgi:phosphoglycolate phosphatase-like HAD superfamily hydrolase
VTIFLDLDGPILDVSQRYYRMHCDVLAGLNLPSAPARRPVKDRQTYWKMRRAGRPLRDVLAKTGGGKINENEYKREWLRRIESLNYLEHDAVIPGARAEVARLSKAHVLVLVTLRRNRKGLESQLKRLGLRRYFHKVLSTAPLARESWKIKRELILSSGLLDRSSWVVGDSEVDILAGKSLRLKTVGVLSGIFNRRRLQEINPDFILEDIRGLGRLLSRESRKKKSG